MEGVNAVGTLSALHGYAEELERRLRLKTFPIAVKMLEKEGDIPAGATRPKRDLGFHLATCQGFSMSRREGTHIAMLKEDMWCSESVIGLGLAQPPQYFFDGYSRYPEDNASLEAGMTWAREFPRFEAGKYVGIVSSPLATANFEPDVIIVYCDSTQLKVLLSAAAWKEGHELTCTVSGKGACVYAVVPVMQHGRCQVTTPCGGDKRLAMSQDDEMIFAAPQAKVEELLVALRELEKYVLRLPFRYVMMPEYKLRESYVKIGKMMGMDLEVSPKKR
jgi:uncharacterized protein (DUF169 family)